MACYEIVFCKACLDFLHFYLFVATAVLPWFYLKDLDRLRALPGMVDLEYILTDGTVLLFQILLEVSFTKA